MTVPRAHRLQAIAVPLGAVLLVAALVVARRPDAFTRPQFWAEDGTFWFAAAYNDGPLVGLQTPAGGYYQSFARLTAAASLYFGLREAPLLFNVAAVLAQILAPLYLLSSRFARTIPDVRLRLLAALLVVGAPNTFEVQSNVTNAQTHLALLGFLIVVADAPQRAWWTVLDVCGLVLTGLSGPTCVFLVIVALLVWWREGSARHVVQLVTVAAVAVVQGLAIVSTGPATRIATPLGASLRRLLTLLGGQIFFAGMLGQATYERFFGGGGEASWLLPCLGLVGLLVVARASVLTSSWPLRMLILFAGLVLAAALLSPVVGAAPRWRTLELPGVGGRYYVLPILAWLAVLLWGACADPRPGARWLARLALAAVLLIGLPRDWRVAPREDFHFPDQVARFASAPPGTLVRIPIPPAGWHMALRKR